MDKSDYSKEFRYEVVLRLMVNGYDYDKTLKQLKDPGISRAMLHRWEKEFPDMPGVEKLLQRAIERVLADVPQFSGKEWGIVVGILFDKWLLLRGQPTSRTENITTPLSNIPINQEERDAVIREAEEIIKNAIAGSRKRKPGAGGSDASGDSAAGS